MCVCVCASVCVCVCVCLSVSMCVCRCVCLCVYQVNKNSKYPKKKCSRHGYLIQNISAKQNIYFLVKIQENKKLYSIINLFCPFKLIRWLSSGILNGI